MLIEESLSLQIVDVPSRLLLNLLFKLPEVLIFRQLFGICDHFDDFTVCLELFEDIDFDVGLVIDFLEVLLQVLELPLTQQDSVVQDALRRHPVECFLNRSPVFLRQRVVGQIHHHG